jgi:hypothetical protein
MERIGESVAGEMQIVDVVALNGLREEGKTKQQNGEPQQQEISPHCV